jgi:putative PIN family toxin of toxin-antitoxin system
MNKDRLVFDCNVYAQALVDTNGPAGQCMSFVLADRVEVFLCPQIIQEIQELPQKKVGVKYGITETDILVFTKELLAHAVLFESFPTVYTHPIDPDDSMYVNLAVAAGAKLIVSNDNHLLNLNNPAKPWSQDFRQRFQDIQVFKPAEYLEDCRQRERQQQQGQ